MPLLGRIAAGNPSVVVEDIEAEIPLPRAYYRGRDLFALRVRGDSMIDAGIRDGDIAIVEKRPDAKSGQIAAVIVGDDATLKRVFHSASEVRLHAENPKYADRVFSRDELQSVLIAGVLIGIVRSITA